jgi:hypothetical protein
MCWSKEEISKLLWVLAMRKRLQSMARAEAVREAELRRAYSQRLERGCRFINIREELYCCDGHHCNNTNSHLTVQAYYHPRAPTLPDITSHISMATPTLTDLVTRTDSSIPSCTTAVPGVHSYDSPDTCNANWLYRYIS